MMFKKFFMVSLIISLVACGGHEQKDQHNVVDEVNPEAESRSERNQAVVLLNNLGFAIQVDLEAKEIKKWGTPLRIMDVVEYLEEEVELSFNNRKAIYVKIRLKSNDEGYANKNYIVTNAIPGVIVAERASFYRQPDLASPDNRFLIQGDLFAVLNDSAMNNFLKVAYANPNDAIIINNRFIKAETISTTYEDVNSMVMYFLALRTQDLNIRKELLQNAASFQSNYFNPLIQTELIIAQNNFQQEIITKNNQYQVLFDESLVYSLPTGDGPIVATLPTGEKLSVKRKLQRQNEIWYEISEPSHGFVRAEDIAIVEQ